MAGPEGRAGAAVELRGLPPDAGDELLTLYFENRRRSGGGPVLGWRRLGRGGVLTFREPADAARVLAREHELRGARLSLRPAAPRAPGRLLLQGLPPGAAPGRLEALVGALLRAAGRPPQPCRALDSPRPDRALVQLREPLSEADVRALEQQAGALRLEGAPVALGPVPQARAVRLVRAEPPVDPLLLELYLESEARSGGGALEGLRQLPGRLGTVVAFRQWQAAERVLQRQHQLQGSQLSLVPHYDVLEPEELAGDLGAGGRVAGREPGGPERAPLEAGGPGGPPSGSGAGSGRPGPQPGTAAPPSPPPAAGCPAPEGPADLLDVVVPMEPGALRFLQLHRQDLLAGLAHVALVPLDGAQEAGFRLCGAPGPCRAAEDFVRSLLGGVGRHALGLPLPGSARFLLSPEGQAVLRALEARFCCVFGTERLAAAALESAPDTEVEDPTEALQAAPGPPADGRSLGEIRELLLALGLGEEAADPEAADPDAADPDAADPDAAEPLAPGPPPPEAAEEAELQLALHRSLEPPGREAEWEEAAALQRALALSLLEAQAPPAGVLGDAPLAGGLGDAPLLVHLARGQDVGPLERALGAALEQHVREETVGPCGRPLPAELQARLERYHGVSAVPCGPYTVLRGFGAQPARAARHLAALLAGPADGSPACPLEAAGPEEPPGGLEPLAESGAEFRAVVQAFYDSLDAARSRVRIVRVERAVHPLLRRQYEAHRGLLERRGARRPVERVLYHGTWAAAVADICARGFNRSFSGRNGTLYGQGVYFAERAALSVQDRYSPPDARGHKAIFVARVLTGDYGQGHPGLRAPPLREAGAARLRYDSAVDCPRRPRVFVVFHDTQALPTHLITCRLLPAAPGLAGPAAPS